MLDNLRCACGHYKALHDMGHGECKICGRLYPASTTGYLPCWSFRWRWLWWIA